MAFYAAGATVIPLLVIAVIVQLRWSWQVPVQRYVEDPPERPEMLFDLVSRCGFHILVILLAAVGEACDRRRPGWPASH
jgi:hypothetical protein